MSKGSKSSGNNKKTGKISENSRGNNNTKPSLTGYLVNMGNAPSLDESAGRLQMLPIIVFTAAIIMIVRLATYERDMSKYYWYASSSEGLQKLTDFFSYYKMIAIIVCAAVCLVILLYRVFIQSFCIKKSFVYIPMIIYSAFVILSYIASDYKDVALYGWNDRFEGTLTLLSYMVMLFYVVNTVQTEKNVKWILNVLAVTSSLLSFLGISQALGHDFFRTTIGKKLITPSWFWDRVDSLHFTFENNEIYQTVYNINYVSFYLTLLIPIFGLLFIHSIVKGTGEAFYKKIIWGALFALLLFNLIGSASSGGILGMAVVVLIALVVLNKRIITWWKPVCILLILTVLTGGITIDRWAPEISGSVKRALNIYNTQPLTNLAGGTPVTTNKEGQTKHKFTMVTSGDAIVLGYQGEEIIFQTYPDDPSSLAIKDLKENKIAIKSVGTDTLKYQIDDERYSWITVRPAKDDNENNYIIIGTDEQEWNFRLTENGPKYYTPSKALIDLRQIPSYGWENNPKFGSGRGYIWSRTIPMFKSTILLGHGADTYCIYFPQDDYVGKYTLFSDNPNIIVDKPHNMYFGYIIGTGLISVLALLALWFTYIVQSFLIYFRRKFNDYLSFAGAGVFLGICGFLTTAFVDDSSVSVMPMFYGLLGTGIAINMMLKRKMDEVKADIK